MLDAAQSGARPRRRTAMVRRRADRPNATRELGRATRRARRTGGSSADGARRVAGRGAARSELTFDLGRALHHAGQDRHGPRGHEPQ